MLIYCVSKPKCSSKLYLKGVKDRDSLLTAVTSLGIEDGTVYLVRAKKSQITSLSDGTCVVSDVSEVIWSQTLSGIKKDKAFMNLKDYKLLNASILSFLSVRLELLSMFILIAQSIFAYFGCVSIVIVFCLIVVSAQPFIIKVKNREQTFVWVAAKHVVKCFSESIDQDV